MKGIENRRWVLFAAVSAVWSSPATLKAEPPVCVLPVCEMTDTLEDFRAMRENRRFSFLEQMTEDYRDNRDVANAENLIQLGHGVLRILQAESVTTGNVRAQAILLLDQSFEQVAVNAPIAADKLLPSFRALQSQPPRYRVLAFWTGRVPALADVAQLRKLREFFQAAKAVTEAAHDEAYVTREALRGEELVNARIIELAPPVAVIAAPIADLNRAVSEFRALDFPSRLLHLRRATEAYRGNSDSRKLVSLIEYSRRLSAEVLAGAGPEQAEIVAQNAALLNESLEQVVKNSDLGADQLATYYGQLQSPNARYQTLAFWQSKLATMTDLVALEKLSRFFHLAAEASTRLGDDAFVARDAYRFEAEANQRLMELGAPPALAIPIADVPRAVESFRGMTLPQRFLLLQKLANDYRASTNARALVSLYAFAKGILPVLTAAGEPQAFILAKNRELLAQTVELLCRSKDLTADELLTYFRDLEVQAQRYAVIQHWAAEIERTSDKPLLQKLARFLNLARRHCNTLEDEDYVVREAQRAEQRAKAKIAELGG